MSEIHKHDVSIFDRDYLSLIDCLGFFRKVFHNGKLSHFIDGRGNSGNWMAYVNCARYAQEQNLIAVQVCKTQCDFMHFCNTAMHWLSYACFCSISLGYECEDNVCWSVCLDVELKNMIAPIELMFLHKTCYRAYSWLGPPARLSGSETRMPSGSLKLDIN